MIQELGKNKIIATDGEQIIIFDVSEEVYSKYIGNNAREITKGSDDKIVIDKWYSYTKTTYILKHYLNVLGVPIFFIETIKTDMVRKTDELPASWITNINGESFAITC